MLLKKKNISDPIFLYKHTSIDLKMFLHLPASTVLLKGPSQHKKGLKITCHRDLQKVI